MLASRLATCTNIRRPLSLCEWTIFTCVLNHFDSWKHLRILWFVSEKPLRERAPRMSRLVCKAENTREHAQIRIALHQIVLAQQHKTWGICSEHAHALRGPDPIVVSPSKWALFCVRSMWTAFLPFVLYVNLNKILLSSAHIALATHKPHPHIFAAISRIAPHQTTLFGAVLILIGMYVVRFAIQLAMQMCEPGFKFHGQ